MTKYTVVNTRPETAAEAAQREWFEKQVLASPDRLEEAARLIIGLVTGLVGLLYGVLAIESEKLPAYLQLPLVRGLGVVTVVLLVLALLEALIVVLPLRLVAASARPKTQAAAFADMLRRKSAALTLSVASFAIGLVTLGAVLIIALVTVA